MRLQKVTAKLFFLGLAIMVSSCSIIKPRALPVSTQAVQISYLQDEDNYSNIYSVDIDCFDQNVPCVSESNLLFRTFPDSSGEQNIPSGLIGDYSWSPDGEKIVLSANSDIFIGNTSIQNWENISNSLDVDERLSVWSKDGNYIYYLACTQDEFGTGSCKLARSRSDVKDKVILLEQVEDSINTFAISPDGETIIFSASHEGYDRLYQSNPNSSNAQLITTSDMEEMSPSFSPDGKRIALVRNNSPILSADMKEVSDLILRDLKTGEEKNLTDKFDESVGSPIFSIDGKWLVFTSFDDNLDANIFIVSIDEAVILQVTQGINDKTHPSWRLNNAK